MAGGQEALNLDQALGGISPAFAAACLGLTGGWVLRHSLHHTLLVDGGWYLS